MRWGSFVVVHRCRCEGGCPAVKGDISVRRGLSLRGVVLPCPDCSVQMPCVSCCCGVKDLEGAVSFEQKGFPGGGELLRMRGLEVAA